jgi:hypothetical protein
MERRDTRAQQTGRRKTGRREEASQSAVAGGGGGWLLSGALPLGAPVELEHLVS